VKSTAASRVAVRGDWSGAARGIGAAAAGAFPRSSAPRSRRVSPAFRLHRLPMDAQFVAARHGRAA
jgi:hypothetical protein